MSTTSPRPSCIFLFIFLAWLQARQEDGAVCPLARGQTAVRVRSLPSGTPCVRGGARAARAFVSALEPLIEPCPLRAPCSHVQV